jgi:hypothetical protein
MCDLDLNAEPSIGLVCDRFLDDANRAFVWLIRFRALQAWYTRADANGWPSSGGCSERASEVAASFALNDEWDFDTEGFYSAVRALSVGR